MLVMSACCGSWRCVWVDVSVKEKDGPIFATPLIVMCVCSVTVLYV